MRPATRSQSSAAAAIALIFVLGMGSVRADERHGRGVDSPPIDLMSARTLARKRGTLIYAHVGAADDRPTALGIETRRALTERYVVLVLSGAGDDQASNELRIRYNLHPTVPVSVALTESGARVATDLAFDLPQAQEDMQEAEANAKSYRELVVAIQRKPGPLASRKLAYLHFNAWNYDAAIPLLRQLMKQDPTEAPDFECAVGALIGVGRRAEAEDILREMIDKWPDDPQRIEWRMYHATVRLDPRLLLMAKDADLRDEATVQAGAGALQELLSTVQSEGDVRAEAAIRARLAEFFWLDLVEPLLHHEWIVRHDPTGPHAENARGALVNLAVLQGKPELALEHARALLRDVPGADEDGAIRDALIPDLTNRVSTKRKGDARPLDVQVRWQPGNPRVAQEAYVVVTVTNTTRQPLSQVWVDYIAHGPYEAQTKSDAYFEVLEPGESVEVMFGIAPKGMAPIHAIVRTSHSGGKGILWSRLPPVKAEKASR